jgi:hypothetical protein
VPFKLVKHLPERSCSATHGVEVAVFLPSSFVCVNRIVIFCITVLSLLTAAKFTYYSRTGDVFFQTVNFMEMGMTPELMYGQNVYVPTNGNPYTYGYAGKF